MISEAVRRFAEEPGRFLPEPSPPSRRISDERFIVGRGVLIRFMAYVDDEPVAAAQLSPCEAGGLLGGSATNPEARGRGAYRALVRARWDEVVRRATPALVIQAGAMSRPILERIGFAPLFEVPVLLDPATDG